MRSLKSIHIAFVFLCLIALLTSCGSIDLPNGTYKYIGKNLRIIKVDSSKCDLYKYQHKFLFFKSNLLNLNGTYCVDDYGNLTCAEFSKGILNGKYFIFIDFNEHQFLYKEGYFKNGLLDGSNYLYIPSWGGDIRKVGQTSKIIYESGYVNGFVEIYKDEYLVQKATYKNSLKNGYEYFFSKEGDTLNVVHYDFNPEYKSTRKVSHIISSNHKSSFNKLIFEVPTLDRYICGKFYSETGVSYSSELGSNTPMAFVDFIPHYAKIKGYCSPILSSKDEAESFFIVVGNGEPYYDLYFIDPPDKVLDLGQIHKDDL